MIVLLVLHIRLDTFGVVAVLVFVSVFVCLCVLFFLKNKIVILFFCHNIM
jgi:hypothetical protein